MAGFTAFKQSSIELKCIATITRYFGGKVSNCNVISVVKANVPSLPANNFATLISSFSINSSIA